MRKEKKRSINLAILGGLVLFVVLLLNYISGFIHLQLDLTEDKRFSLAPETIEILENDSIIKDRITFTVYLDGELPSQVKEIQKAIQQKLDQFSSYSGQRITYDFIDPSGHSDEQLNESIQRQIYHEGEGIQFVDLKITRSSGIERQRIWPGATITYQNRTAKYFNFFEDYSLPADGNLEGLVQEVVNDLEYKLVSNIIQTIYPDRKKIGFLTGHGEVGSDSTYHARMVLSQFYDVEEVSINGQINALDHLDALYIVGPTKRFSDKDKFIIDQFCMRGGAISWYLDNLNIEYDSLLTTGATYGLLRDLNLDDMPFRYGAKVNPDLVVSVDNSAVGLMYGPERVTKPWSFWPNAFPNKDLPATRNLDLIQTRFASSIDTVKAEGIKKTVLLASSPRSSIRRQPVRINYGMIELPNQGINPDTENEYIMGVMLEGKFNAAIDKFHISPRYLESAGARFIEQSPDNKMVVFGTSSLVYNDIDVKTGKDGQQMRYPLSLDQDKYRLPNQPYKIYNNTELLINTAELLLQDVTIAEIRKKAIKVRLLDTTKIKEEAGFWKTLNFVLPLLIITLIVVIAMFIRKKRFAS